MVVLSVPPRGWVKPYVVTSHVLSAAIQNKVEYLVSGDKGDRNDSCEIVRRLNFFLQNQPVTVGFPLLRRIYVRSTR